MKGSIQFMQNTFRSPAGSGAGAARSTDQGSSPRELLPSLGLNFDLRETLFYQFMQKHDQFMKGSLQFMQRTSALQLEVRWPRHNCPPNCGSALLVPG